MAVRADSGTWPAEQGRSGWADTLAAALVAVVVAAAVASSSVAFMVGPGRLGELGAGAASAVTALAGTTGAAAPAPDLAATARTGAKLAARGYPVGWDPALGDWRVLPDGAATDPPGRP